MIVNIGFNINAGKGNKISEFYTICPKNARLHNSHNYHTVKVSIT